MAQAISHWPVIAKGPVKSIASQSGICGGPSNTGRDLPPPLHSFIVIPATLHIHLHVLTNAIRRTSGRFWEREEINALSDPRYTTGPKYTVICKR